MRAKLLFWLKKDGHKNEIFHQPGLTWWHTPDEWPIPIAEEDPDSDSYFEINDNNKICLFLKEDEKIVFNKKKQIEHFLICYEYETD